VLIAVGSSAARARQWTDDSRLYHAEAEFVALVGTNVRLQMADGRTMDVPLDRLCPWDRMIARELGRPAGHWASPQMGRDGDTLITIQEGHGATPQEALKDAFDQAVKVAQGTYWQSVTEVDTAGPAREHITAFSAGFVQHYEVLQDRLEKGIWKRRIAAIVTVSTKDDAAAGTGDSVWVSAQDLFAQAYTKVRRRNEALAFVTASVRRMPAEVLKMSLVGQPEIARLEESAVTISCKVSLSIDQDRYQEIVKELIPALEVLAVREGMVRGDSIAVPKQFRERCGSIFRSWFFGADDGNPGPGRHAQVTFSALKVFRQTVVSGLPKGAVRNYEPAAPSTLVFVDVGFTRRGDWRWFEIDSAPDFSPGKVAVTLSYEGNGAVPARCYTIAFGPAVPVVSLSGDWKSNHGLRSILISPTFLVRNGDGYKVQDVVVAESAMVQNEARFTIDELSQITAVALKGPSVGRRAIETAIAGSLAAASR
jgi:hypothetical protein